TDSRKRSDFIFNSPHGLRFFLLASCAFGISSYDLGTVSCTVIHNYNSISRVKRYFQIFLRTVQLYKRERAACRCKPLFLQVLTLRAGAQGDQATAHVALGSIWLAVRAST